MFLEYPRCDDTLRAFEDFGPEEIIGIRKGLPSEGRGSDRIVLKRRHKLDLCNSEYGVYIRRTMEMWKETSNEN